MTGGGLTGSLVDSRLVVGGGLNDSRGLFSVGLVLPEIVRSGVQEASELQCWLLGDLDMANVSVSLLVIRLLLSSLRLL
jgi:hypothetical protein